jgi:probable rRNA maturation factor
MPVSIENRQNLFNVDLKRVRRSLTKLIKELHCVDNEIALLFVDDDQIMELNNKYLNRNYPTNVISFAMTEGEFGNINQKILGDIVISVETAYRDASVGQIDPRDALDFLIIHGLLHLLGYNHEETNVEKTKEMNTREQELFFLLRNYNLD